MKIGVVGLGLIGGSTFKKLKALNHDVVGISNSQNGKDQNITNNINALTDCEIVFVATPMNKTIEKLHEIEKVVKPDTVVTDCCSLKEFLENETFNFKFIPSHPMAGTEFQGYENSFEDLFIGAKWVITPINDTSTKTLENIIKQLGAMPIITTTKEHDKAVALISHMPMVLAQALMENVKANNLAQRLASSGFRDMTRLALSNTEMAKDMVNLNHKNIQESILKLYSVLGDLIKDYPNKIEEIKFSREKMYKDGKNVL